MKEKLILSLIVLTVIGVSFALRYANLGWFIAIDVVLIAPLIYAMCKPKIKPKPDKPKPDTPTSDEKK